MGRRGSGERFPAACEMAGACLAVRARLVSRWLTAIYEHAGEEIDLTVPQGNILAAVGSMGECTPLRLGEVLSLERSTVSRNIVPLVERGLFGDESNEAGRVRRGWLTPAGERMLERLLPAWRNAQREAADLLGADGVAALHQLSELFWGRGGAGEPERARALGRGSGGRRAGTRSTG
ncbi:MAG: winged helix-turn-helix transcriptional regulator [Phycisphaerales bacterium]|nr:winged helix-turn-helix transcriptional regulator [Phycisphaerales bacterium]